MKKLLLLTCLTSMFLMFNNEIHAQCLPTESSVSLTIDFTQDNYPDEDGWKFIDVTNNTTIDSVCFGTYSGNGVVSVEFCVIPNNTYKLLALDDYGDGLDGATYSLDYTYGNNIDSIETTNHNIPYSHCGGIYTTSSIVDSIEFTATLVSPPSCQPPSNVDFDNITPTSIEVNMTDTASTWEMEYGPSNFTQGTGTSFFTTNNPDTISGLTQSTVYDLYIRSICSANDTSSWTGPIAFITECDTITTFPYFEGFNSSVNCWRKDTVSGSENWNQISGSSGDIATPYEGSGFMEKDYINSDAILISPPFDFTNLTTNGQVRIWLHRHNNAANNDIYRMYANNTPDLNGADTLLEIHSLTTIAPTAPATGWYEYMASVPATYANDSRVYIILQGVTSSNIFSYDLGADAFTLEEIPSCPQPSNLSATNISTNSADLGWINNSSSILWEIEYDTTGFTLGNGNSSFSNTNPTTISGLNDNTEYEFYVRSVCGVSDTSTWTGPFSFRTACSAVATFPYVEDFDGILVDSAWACWKVVNADGGHTWRQGNQYLSSTHSAPYAAQGMGNQNDYLISPQINLPNSSMTLSLWDKVENTNFNNTYHILVSTTGNNAADFTDTLATINAKDTAWTKRTVYLSPYAGQNIYIAIYQTYSAADYYGFGVDDFTIDYAPPCAFPTNLTASNVTNDSADISWVENGAATSWQIEYGPNNFTLGNGNSSVTSSNPTTFSGLVPNSRYQVYVRAICAVGDTSAWTGPISFRTICNSIVAPYAEDFENNGNIPICWRHDENNNENWFFASSIFGSNHVGNNGNFNSSTISGNTFAYIDDSSPHSNNTTLLSPFIDVSAATNPLLSFFRISNNEGHTNVDFSVDVWDGNSWNQVYFADTNSVRGEWEQIVIPLNGLTITDDIQVRLVVDENNGNDLYDDVGIDDFYVGDLSQFTPYYPLADLNNVDAVGVADSVGVEAFTSGVVAGVDLNGSNGFSFTIIDSTYGDYEGIHVTSPNMVSNYTVNEGDYVMLRGIVQQTNGLQEILVDSIRMIDTASILPLHKMVTVLDEGTESELVEMTGLTVTAVGSGASYDISVTDGNTNFTIRIEEETDVDNVHTFMQGDEICFVKGIGGQNDPTSPYIDDYTITPIYSSDIHVSPNIDLGADTIVCDTALFILDAGAGYASYSWNTGEKTRIIQPTAANDSLYIATVVDSMGCIGTDTVIVNIDICTGLSNFSNNKKLSVSPNPSKGVFYLHIESIQSTGSILTVRDIGGRIVLEQKIIPTSNSKITIDIREQSKGIYFINLRNGDKLYNRKIVVQ